MQKLSNDELLEIIKDGKGAGMPAFEKKFSKENVQQVIIYLRNLSAKG